MAIHRLIADAFLGLDYRAHPCGLANALSELRGGDGSEAAWRELERQRVEDDVQGALLAAGYGITANLVLFVTGRSCVREFERVEEIERRREEVRSGGMN